MEEMATIKAVTERARREFARRLNAQLETLGVPEDRRASWLREQVGCRWQTAQFWLLGKSTPEERYMDALGTALGMDANSLFGGSGSDGSDGRASGWHAFLKTPEGRSATVAELEAMQTVEWPQEPTVADLRSLLAVLRANSDR